MYVNILTSKINALYCALTLPIAADAAVDSNARIRHWPIHNPVVDCELPAPLVVVTFG